MKSGPPGLTPCSLNPDPYNVRAEELALEECIGGRDVRRTWSEQELVRCFAGGLVPGTPDGMFELWDGSLHCVQVVRAPLLGSMAEDDQREALAQTVLTKVVKSQLWLRATQVTPTEFTIFTWLPFAPAPGVLRHAEELMERVRKVDGRFALALRTPPACEELFPALFACCVRKVHSFSESDVSTQESLYDAEASEDEEVEWDITWDWLPDDWG